MIYNRPEYWLNKKPAIMSFELSDTFITIPFREYAKENQKPLAVIGGDI